MEWSLKIVVVMILLLVFLVVVIFIIAQSGETSHDIIQGIYNFFHNLITGEQSFQPDTGTQTPENGWTDDMVGPPPPDS